MLGVSPMKDGCRGRNGCCRQPMRADTRQIFWLMIPHFKLAYAAWTHFDHPPEQPPGINILSNSSFYNFVRRVNVLLYVLRIRAEFPWCLAGQTHPSVWLPILSCLSTSFWKEYKKAFCTHNLAYCSILADFNTFSKCSIALSCAIPI